MRMLQDNYAYYVHRTNDINKGYFIDVSEPEKVEAFRKEFNITEPVRHILTTHGHLDHSGANVGLQDDYPELEVMGGIKDDVPGCTHPVDNGDTFTIFDGDIKVKCYHTPCHTKGHMIYYMEAKGAVDGVEHEYVTKGEY